MSKIIGKTCVAPPNVGSTQTFITVGNFATEQEAINCWKYINTKFARTLLSINKVTQHNPPATWKDVPLQDFSSNSDIDWAKPIYDIDTQLYRKYGLSADEIHFIEHMIQYRVEVLNENYRPYIEDYEDE